MSLLNATFDVLVQLEQAILASRAIYTSSNVGSPIGKHIRHILDHFDVFLVGVETGLIDYNHRSRDSIAETEPEAALARLSAIRGRLSAIKTLNKTVEIETEVSIHQTESHTLASTLARELVYVESHTIHHLAYIRLIAKYFEVEIDETIGLAPATASYIREN